MKQTLLLLLLLVTFTLLVVVQSRPDLHGETSLQEKWVQKERERRFDLSKLKPRPDGVSLSFDCKARIAAYQYAQKIQSWRGNSLKAVWEALELTEQCGQKWVDLGPAESPVYRPAGAVVGQTFYVDSNKGSDSNPGTRAAPFKTIGHAVVVARSSPGPNTILLRAGTYYLQETIQLNTLDNGLTIANYAGETVYISGGIPLTNLNWKPYNVSSKPLIAVYENQNNVYNQVSPGGSTTSIRYIGSFDTTQDCMQACLKYIAPGGITCKSFTYHTSRLGGPYARQCFAFLDYTWGPTGEANINSGKIVQPNIYVADVKGMGIKEMLGLQFPNGQGRATRARYPDGDTETVRFPSGFVLKTSSYLPARKYPTPTTIIVQTPQRNDITMFQQYSMGIGGPCSIFSPPESYWCSSQNAGGASGLFETPSGLTYLPNTFVGVKQPFSNAVKDGVIHMWHPYHWAMWMYKVDAFSTSTRTIGWTYGGFQGSRGAISGGGKGGEWYLENVLELLDSPNEFFYDAQNQKLYYFYNGTTAPPSNFQLVSTNLKTLFEVLGSQSNPVQNVTFFGLNFVNTAYTYLDPHGVPSGGDWGMQRSAALFLEGTEGTTINACNFTRLDGNAVMLSGYHRDALIRKSEFSWIGDSMLVAWGDTEGIDGTNGNQPRGTKIIENFFHEMGMFEKQASAWFQAKSCQTLIKGNIMFNGPRALININDGFGGANEITENLLFNPNRETSDQGPFNSWDRLPFLTEVRNGTPSLTPAYNELHHNFLLCNYGSNMCIDNDDGSSYYNLHENFEIYGGHKSDFGGHNKFTYNTVVAMAQDYGKGVCGDFNDAVPGYVDGYYNNTCVQAAVVPYLNFQTCDINNPTSRKLPIVHDNKVYNSANAVTATCGSTTLPEAQFQAKGFDKGTKVYPMPSDDQIIAWGKAILNM